MNIILDNGAFKLKFAHKADVGVDLRSPVEKEMQLFKERKI